MTFRFAVGQDSHAFEKSPEKKYAKPLVLGGVVFDGYPCLSANSDGDVILHALTNAVSGITCKNILGKVADDMCKRGITDSAEYYRVALKDLAAIGGRLVSISVSVEASRPKFAPKIDEIRHSLAALSGLPENACGITATSGERLTSFGRGLGIAVIAAVTVSFED